MKFKIYENSDKFIIDNDRKADWAIERIKESEEERDRLMLLIKDKEADLVLKKEKILNDFEYQTSGLLDNLNQYMPFDKSKETKTQFKYTLLAGNLVYKKPSVKIEKDNQKLLDYVKTFDKDNQFIKTTESVDWSGFKAYIDLSNDIAVNILTGEVLGDENGIMLKHTDGELIIK